MEAVVQKIKELRRAKGLSNENIAHELGISLSAYNKLERNETKLTIERLYQVANILGEPIEKLLNITAKNNFEQQNKDSATGYQQQIENYYAENKELVNRLENNYQTTIQYLRSEIDFLRKKL